MTEVRPKFPSAFFVASVLVVLLCAGSRRSAAQGLPTFQTPQQLLAAMLAHEKEASEHHDRWEYLSNERSDRTGQHLWTERVIDTSVGKVRFLVAEDGKPLSPQRAQQEQARMADIAAHPDAFARSELAQKNEEEHGRQMMDVLPRGFVLENVKLEGGTWHMDFRPNPDYSPSGIEERVLHGMSGWIAIDARELRLVHIEGSLPADVGIGFGLLANIKAGSHFMSDRQFVDGRWHTVHVITDIRGKAALFKTVARNSDWVRSEFRLMDANITPGQAVALLVR